MRMYSKNDYRYYLEHRLLVSDDYLAHYGVMGMKWGVRHDERRAALVSKRDANNAKIAKYQNKLNTVGAQKRAAKAAKYQHKVDKLQRKASKAEKRLAQGKNVSNKQMKKVMKYESYKAKVAKNSAKNDKYQMKIAHLQAKNTKLDKKISKMDRPSRFGAFAYQVGLNSLDNGRAKNLYKSENRLTQKGRDKSTKLYQEHKTQLSDTIKDAKKRGYETDSRPTSRIVSSTFIPTPYGSYYSYTSAPGTQYSVHRPKKKR